MNLLKHIYLSRVHFSKLKGGYDPEDMAVFLMNSPIAVIIIIISLWAIGDGIANESVIIGISVAFLFTAVFISRQFFYSSFSDGNLMQEFNDFADIKKDELHTISLMFGFIPALTLIFAIYILADN